MKIKTIMVLIASISIIAISQVGFANIANTVESVKTANHKEIKNEAGIHIYTCYHNMGETTIIKTPENQNSILYKYSKTEFVYNGEIKTYNKLCGYEEE